MKTFYLIALAIYTSFIGLSQVTITYPQNAPSIGSNYTLHANTDINQSYVSDFQDVVGADQTWDLSEFSGDGNELMNLTPSAGNDSSNFPNADILETSTNFGTSNSETYYRYENGNYYIEGNSIFLPDDLSSPIVRIAYSDDRIFTKYPFSMGDSDTDSFSGVFENILGGQNFERSGTVEIEADGYGSVVLPYGILGNVLRVKAVSTYTDNYLGQLLVSYSETQYLWYQSETNSYIATYNELSANGTISAKVSSYLSEEDYLSIEEKLLAKKISVFPNPSKGLVNIKFSGNSEFEYTVINSQGQEITSGRTDNGFNNTIQLDGLASGVYIFNAVLNENKVSKRFVIE